MLLDWLLRHPARVAILGAMLGVALIFSGLHFHIGSWVADGALAYICSAISGAAVAIVVWYAFRKEFGWP